MSLPEAAPDAITPDAGAASPRGRMTDSTKGVLAALAVYTSWGFLPLLFRAAEAAGSVLIVAERTFWSFILLGVVVLFAGGFGEVRTLFADRKRALLTLVSALLLAGNWLIYIWAVETGQVLEASFGYFINPLVNVLMGMILLGERQNRLQTLALLIAAVAIIIQAVGLGTFPFVALSLALTFGFYGYFRKTAQMGPVSGLFAETAMMAPFAVGFIIYGLISSGPGVHADPHMLAFLVLTGPATAIPLLLFSFAVRQLRLTTMGMFQYIAPSIQFLVAIFLFGEHLSGLRLFSFGLVWVSLMVFSYDSFRRRKRVVAV